MSDMAVAFGISVPTPREPRRSGWLTTQHLLLALDRARPGALLGFLDGTRLHRGGLGNARRALEVIDAAMAERDELSPGGSRPEPVSRDDAVELLGRKSVGRFAYIAREGTPDVVPVNYTWYDDTVLIRSGPGAKLHAAQRGEVVAFEVDDIDAEPSTGMSVVVIGRAQLAEPVAGGFDAATWTESPHRHLIRIAPTRIEGRRVG